MRIEQIKIKNYRVFRDTTIDRIGGMAVFVGNNGTGKSTIFEVLGFLRDCVRIGVRAAVQARGGIDAIRSKDQDGDIEISIVVRGLPTEASSITYYIVIRDQLGLPTVEREGLFSTDVDNDYLVANRARGFATATENSERDLFELAEPYVLALSTIGALGKYPVQHKIKQFIEGIYAFDLSMVEARKRTTMNPTAVSFPSGGTIASITQHMREQRPREYACLLNNLRIVVPEILDVDAVRYEDGEVQVRFQSQFEKAFTSTEISDGTLKMFTYLLLLADDNPPSLLCIDEPENHVYPEHQRVLADFFRIYSAHQQIFVATHAPAFLDAVELPEAYYIEKGSDGFSNIRRVQDIPMVEQFIKEGDPLGALWNQGFFGEGR